MSMNIVVSMEDEEHLLTIHPGDNLIEILKNILGNIHDCKFTVNNKVLWSVNDLSTELSPNTTIEVSRYKTRGAPVSIGLRGVPCELKSVKNPSRPTISIQTVHISCSSDCYDVNEDMAGLIVYSFDNEQIFQFNGHRCRTGYILIKATKNIQQMNSQQGIVHGNLFKWFFGIEPDHRFVGAGFSLHEKIVKFNSAVFNAKNDDYHDESKSMSQGESSLIKYALNELFMNNKWRTNPTLSLENLQRNPYDPGDDLPYQNHPGVSMNNDFRFN